MKFVLLTLKLAISAALAWVVFARVDFAPIAVFLQSTQAKTALVLCVGILIVQALMAALRMRWIMRLMGQTLSFHLGFSTWMMGLLVSQTLVTFIAGDAVRVWQLTQRGYARRLSGSAIFLERALGFAVLMALVLICIPFLMAHGAAGATRSGLLVVAALCAAGIVGFIASGFFHRLLLRFAPNLYAGRLATAMVDVTSAARYLAASWPLTAAVVALSAAMHLMNALAFYALTRAAGVELDLTTVTAIALPVMLIALMPIALAGWGVREGSAAVGYGLFHVDPQIAVAISVAFGLSLLIASLPGGLYLLCGKTPSEPVTKPPFQDAEDPSPAA